MTSAVFKNDEEIGNPDNKRTHVVILGAGASLAAFPGGDKRGCHLPVIKNFVNVVGLDGLLKSNGFNPPYDDFEGLYSHLASNAATKQLANEIEQRVYDYFAEMELTDSISMYDHLVLSLRAKDVIATFNWDPFLWEAAVRNAKIAEPPTLLFYMAMLRLDIVPHAKSFSLEINLVENAAEKPNHPLCYTLSVKRIIILTRLSLLTGKYLEQPYEGPGQSLSTVTEPPKLTLKQSVSSGKVGETRRSA